MYLVLSAFTSSPISLAATTKASAFSFTVCTDLGLTSLIIEQIIYAIGYNFTHSSPPHRMQVNGQIHTPAALPPGKKPSISFKWRFAGLHNQSGRFGKEKNVLPQSGFGLGSTPSFLYSGYRVCFPGVQQPGRGVDHPP
jgi:hypothetical protein